MIELPRSDDGQIFMETGLIELAAMAMALTLLDRRVMQLLRFTRGSRSSADMPDSTRRASFLPVMKGKFFTSLRGQKGDVSRARRYS